MDDVFLLPSVGFGEEKHALQVPLLARAHKWSCFQILAKGLRDAALDVTAGLR